MFTAVNYAWAMTYVSTVSLIQDSDSCAKKLILTLPLMSAKARVDNSGDRNTAQCTRPLTPDP